MKRTIHVKPAAPQYSVITNITFAQTDAWFGHTTQDLRICTSGISERTCESRFCGGIRTVPDQQ